MRTKTLLLAAAFTAAGIASSLAQSVYSVNAVGYINVTVPAGQYKMVGNQLNSPTNTVEVLFAGVPEDTSVLKWSGGAFLINDYSTAFYGGWQDPAMTITAGEGCFIKAPAGAAVTVTFVGEVIQGTAITIPINPGYQIVASKVPQQGLLQGALGYVPVENDQVLRWVGGAYLIYDYSVAFYGGWSEEPSLEVGEAMFINSAATATRDWVRSFTIN
jgi:hypothetical protein